MGPKTGVRHIGANPVLQGLVAQETMQALLHRKNSDIIMTYIIIVSTTLYFALRLAKRGIVNYAQSLAVHHSMKVSAGSARASCLCQKIFTFRRGISWWQPRLVSYFSIGLLAISISIRMPNRLPSPNQRFLLVDFCRARPADELLVLFSSIDGRQFLFSYFKYN